MIIEIWYDLWILQAVDPPDFVFWFQLRVHAGILPILFCDIDHTSVCFSHLLLCKGKLIPDALL